MRPLKQPLECTLIDSVLLDKVFYKIPEILAHHQVNIFLEIFGVFFCSFFWLHYRREWNVYKTKR